MSDEAEEAEVRAAALLALSAFREEGRTWASGFRLHEEQASQGSAEYNGSENNARALQERKSKSDPSPPKNGCREKGDAIALRRAFTKRVECVCVCVCSATDSFRSCRKGLPD